MKKQFFKTTLLMAFGTILFQSCQQEDTTPPVISSVSVNDTLGQDFAVMPGDSLYIRFTVTDENSLSQFRASIHDAADGHGHDGETDTAAVVPNVGLWVDNRVQTLAGTTVSKTLLYVVPDSIHGVWHWELQAIDESGNAAEEFVVEFDVQ
jgi:hypothetical protein